jgi:hypothetical protein
MADVANYNHCGCTAVGISARASFPRVKVVTICLSCFEISNWPGSSASADGQIQICRTGEDIPLFT